ncbi:MAG: hypothetical protein ACE5JX_18985 [Acidobacteriota bacterium]
MNHNDGKSAKKSKRTLATQTGSSHTILLIFIDGLGIGQTDPTRNPWAAIDSTIFTHFMNRDGPQAIACGGTLSITDARLGVTGLPQSATGQTTLLTGVNAPALLGRHLSGYPNQKLKDLLARESIFMRLARRKLRCTFANCYQPDYLQRMPRRVSVTTSACLSAGLRLRTLDDLRAGQAVYQDFTHHYLQSKGWDVELLSPEQAGANLAALCRQYDFTLYEYFITDLTGHSCDWDRGLRVAENLERFLLSVLQHLNLDHQTLVLSSDHGNYEDFSVRTHTLNPVYTICWGPRRVELAGSIRSIQNITPALVRLLT